MLFTLSTNYNKNLTWYFCTQKPAQVPFTRAFSSHKWIHSRFLLPQVDSRTFLGSKIVPFWCGKNNVKKVVKMSLQNKRGDAY